MLTIQSIQMEIFEKATLYSFEDEMLLHSHKFSPRLCEVTVHAINWEPSTRYPEVASA